MADKLLEVTDLHVMYRTDDDNVYALNGVDISVEKGKTLGLGEKPAPARRHWRSRSCGCCRTASASSPRATSK